VEALTALVVDTSAPWKLNDQISLRDEAFGALAYHHGTRRLVFLKSRQLVEIVRRLEQFDSADAAIAALAPPEQRARYATALVALCQSEVISGR
jgi:putative mycofactocin binding protein MftB